MPKPEPIRPEEFPDGVTAEPTMPANELAKLDKDALANLINNPPAAQPDPTPAEEDVGVTEEEEEDSLYETGEGPEREESEESESAEEESKDESEDEQPVPSEIEEMRIALEEAKMQAKHFESLVGRDAGELDFLKRKVRDLEAGLSKRMRSAEASDLDDGAEYSREPDSDVLRIGQQIGRMSEYLTRSAFQQTLEAFAGAHDDLSSLGDSFKNAATEGQSLVDEALKSGDPVLVQQTTERVLENAYWKAKRTILEQKRAEMERLRADRAAKLKAKKRAAAVSGSAGAGHKKPRKTVNLDQLSTEELRKLIDG